MGMDFVLRPALPQDAAAVCAVFLSAREQSLPYLPLLHTRQETQTWIRDWLLPTTAVWVAECAGSLVGFCSVSEEKLEQLYVHPEFQGKGVGAKLLQKAREVSPKRLQLYTFVRNREARRFYERHGFRAIAFGQDNEENEPDVLYEWISD